MSEDLKRKYYLLKDLAGDAAARYDMFRGNPRITTALWYAKCHTQDAMQVALDEWNREELAKEAQKVSA